jgi:hypothetical protein
MTDHPQGDSSGNEGDIDVALDTLAASDGTAPSVGDEVEVHVKGTVSRIDEATNCCYVTPETLNGAPPPSHNDDETSGDSLRNQAQQADASSSGY